MFAISGTVTVGDNPVESLQEMGVEVREQDGMISMQTELFAMNIDKETGAFGYQGKGPMVLDEEVLGEIISEFKNERVFTTITIESLHIAETLPFLLPPEEFEEYSADDDEVRRYVQQGEDTTSYRREIGEFELYAHKHDDDEGLHVHEIICRHPGDNPLEKLDELKRQTQGLEIYGLDFSGHSAT